MAKKIALKDYIVIYILVLLSALLLTLLIDHFADVPVVSVQTDRVTIILDAGHGGEDGGAVSRTGMLESQLNLEMTLRLHDLLRILGYNSVLIRDSDKSMHTQGDTIAARKASDLRHRVAIVNDIPNALLVSIHQNNFPDERYHGAQVFYAPTNRSKELADSIQSQMVQTINKGSRRMAQKIRGVYLLSNINCTAVLVECGFLSNPEEEARLRDAQYQKKLCAVLASSLCVYLDRRTVD